MSDTNVITSAAVTTDAEKAVGSTVKVSTEDVTVEVTEKPKPKSFKEMKYPQLVEVAEAFGVEHVGTNKASLLGALADEGVTFAQWDVFANAEHVDPEEILDAPVVPAKATAKAIENPVLVKMDRKNFRYETFGKVFTQDHPFVLCDEETAQNIFDAEDGFRMATPREVREYYL